MSTKPNERFICQLNQMKGFYAKQTKLNVDMSTKPNERFFCGVLYPLTRETPSVL